MRTYLLNAQGFITRYLVAGPREETCSVLAEEGEGGDQIAYEARLRKEITRGQEEKPCGAVGLGMDSSLGSPWTYYYQHENWFVDYSTFYPVLTNVTLDAFTQLEVKEDMEIRAVIWSYASVDIWCRDEHLCRMTPPVYKPVRRQEVILPLKKGINPLMVRLKTLGVRDTRTLFGIQITERGTEVGVVLPDSEYMDEVADCAAWLSGAVIRDGILWFQKEAPRDATLGYDSLSPDFKEVCTKIVRHDISGAKCVTLEPGRAYLIVECSVHGQRLVRRMEDVAAIRPKSLTGMDFESNKMAVFQRIAAVEALSRGGKFGFSISNILARRATGQKSERDRELLLDTLSQIERRFDCSDFLVCGLIRYMKNYELDQQLRERAEEVLLHYRYWMDQEGTDGMCFWSENHSLMFYVSAMNAGEMYPDRWFSSAHMTGGELYEAGKRRVEQWLDDVEAHGFEEFLSTVYLCVTFAGLLNAIDYSPEEISVRAAGVTDNLLSMLALHTYRGSVIAPMGRVYRQIIYPFLQGAQALMNLIDPDVPYSYGEGWLAFYATSRYQIPPGLKERMQEDVSAGYATGNAWICLEKTKDYCLTSVQSPRTDKGFVRWPNMTLADEGAGAEKNTHAYTKSLNERYHGTTCFQPGIYGYQQHMWSAALDGETQIFTNHPGGTCDSSEMRPGFWYGNGVMPAIRQEGSVLGVIYVIPDGHPIHFTHAFWPGVKFDRMIAEEHWLFGQKGSGYLALWCSEPMAVHQDQVFDCEYRSFGDEIAYCCILGGSEYTELEKFAADCKAEEPVYVAGEKRLAAAGKFEMVYEKCEDYTQYV